MRPRHRLLSALLVIAILAWLRLRTPAVGLPELPAPPLPEVVSATPSADTVIVLGSIERDLTGDGRPEVLRLIARGKTIDSLDVTFSITSSGGLLYEDPLRPLTRRRGYDARMPDASPAEHREMLDGFGGWFFPPEKFSTPEGFVAYLAESSPGHIASIPQVIAENRRYERTLDSLVAGGVNPVDARRRARSSSVRGDSVTGRRIWLDMQRAGVTVFEYSPGGDGVIAIAWSERHKRFYRLFECC